MIPFLFPRVRACDGHFSLLRAVRLEQAFTVVKGDGQMHREQDNFISLLLFF